MDSTRSSEEGMLGRAEVAAWVRDVALPPLQKLALMIAFDHAGPQEDGRWVAWVGNRAIAREGGWATPETARKHLAALEAVGVIEREERRRGNGSLTTNRIVLCVAQGPLRSEGTPASGGDGSPPAGGDQKPHSQAPPENASRASAQKDEFPEDLDPSLHEVAIAAGKILKATALRREQKKAVTRAAVGHAVLSYPDRDHVNVARRVEAWLLYEKGARKPCSDIVARFRNFLDNSEPMAGPPLPAGVSPIRPRGGKPNASDLLNAMGGA